MCVYACVLNMRIDLDIALINFLSVSPESLKILSFKDSLLKFKPTRSATLTEYQ